MITPGSVPQLSQRAEISTRTVHGMSNKNPAAAAVSETCFAESNLAPR